MQLGLLLLPFAVCVAGCATTPVPASAARDAPVERLLAFQNPLVGQSGSLVITRDAGFLGGGCYYAVSINGTVAARLDAGERSKFFVSPGEVLLRAGRDPQGRALCALGKDEWTQRETQINANETKFFRLSIDANGKTDIQRAEQ